MGGQCPKCGAPRAHGPECPQCGVIYARAEQRAYEEKRQQQRPKQEQAQQPQETPIPKQWIKQSTHYSIDCTACKLEAGMEKKSVPRFPVFIRIIGVFIAIPSALGMFTGAISIFSPHTSPTSAGFSIIIGGGFFMLSAVGGLIGWLLLMRKKAFVCSRCGFMLDRA